MPEGTISVTWYGQSMFRIEGGGVTVVIDPTDPRTGYEYAPVSADAILITHNHYDHSFMDGVKNKPDAIDKPGEREAAGLRVMGLAAFHDNAGGRERGEIVMYVWEQAGFRIAHLGDLGERPSPGALAALHGMDILMVPVGGVFTIDGAQASELVRVLKPRIVFPMHYKTPACVVGIEPLENFTTHFKDWTKKIFDRPVTISRQNLPPTTEIWVLPYE